MTYRDTWPTRPYTPAHPAFERYRAPKPDMPTTLVHLLLASDGSVIGATDEHNGQYGPYWNEYQNTDVDFYAEYNIVTATIPTDEYDLIDALLDHGTSHQQFSDGYEATLAVAPYIKA